MQIHTPTVVQGYNGGFNLLTYMQIDTLIVVQGYKGGEVVEGPP